MKQKKKTKVLSLFLSLVMAFAMMPLLGTQEAHAAAIKDKLVVDLSAEAQTYNGPMAAVIDAFLHEMTYNCANYIITDEGADHLIIDFDLDANDTWDITGEFTYDPYGDGTFADKHAALNA